MSDKPSKTASLQLERDLWAQGFARIVGIDEAGRGAWAGPVVAGAVILPPDVDDLARLLEGVRDSKQMTARARARLIDSIRSVAVAHGVGAAEAHEIDALGIVPATCLAMERALKVLRDDFPHTAPDYLLLDSIRWPALANQALPYRALVRGDRLSLSIAAASVLAKVTRDQIMTGLDGVHPEYRFAAHKGYGTAAHHAAIRVHGASVVHRTSFAPMNRSALPKEQSYL